ncbi:MAG: hypothetical protein ACXWZR_07570 [Mycobacterium sp.]
MIGSLITAALRLRAAHRELKAQQLRTDVVTIRSDSVAESGYALAEVA